MWGKHKDVLFIIILGLIIRFVLLPYSQTVHADAISRIINAQTWLANPKYILADVWGPLNQYLFGFSIKFMGGKIFGPKLINILFASFSAYPLYWFTRNIFKTRVGAILVATIYVLTPLVIRNSFQALPAIPFGFFVALSMYYLSVYLTTKPQLLYIVLSGVAINLAGALRYEAWVISFFFGLILLFNKKYLPFFLFGVVASLFPISWLIGNQIVFDNWFYCFQYSQEWGIAELHGLDEITRVDALKRILFLPF
jgi:predicted membrane-bound dolichyl-phosphate-mannose-protein mannosyltransferase